MASCYQTIASLRRVSIDRRNSSWKAYLIPRTTCHEHTAMLILLVASAAHQTTSRTEHQSLA
jgi:hypothetical protein